VEALLAVGDRDRATELAREQRRIAVALGRPWVLALAARCEGCVAAQRGDEDEAIACFERAVQEHAKQERPLERARTLLAYGSLLRRQRRKRAAREALEQALSSFEAAQASLWAQRTRGELGRIGGRRATRSGALSATESEVARLVAGGRTNNEVAEALHLSARTVEWNLSKLYRKLGVRSRTELAMALDSAGGGGPERQVAEGGLGVAAGGWKREAIGAGAGERQPWRHDFTIGAGAGERQPWRHDFTIGADNGERQPWRHDFTIGADNRNRAPTVTNGAGKSRDFSG
jgi:DNA-binding CsgD family transcriptional regulator